MTKISKTAAALLARMQDEGRVGVEWYSGQGPQGGQVSGGERDRLAARALIDAGLAVQQGEIYRSARCRGGFTAMTAGLTLVPASKG